MLPAMAVISLAALLLILAVRQMAEHSNQIDDDRARQAVSAAFRTMQAQMTDMVQQ